jgi:hypothetical protein
MATTLYASAIRDAIKTSDIAKMKAAAAQAKQQIKEQGDLHQALVELEAAIQKVDTKK